jgi:FkbM family methyltransferase
MSVHSQLWKYLRSYPQWKFAPPRPEVTRTVQRVGTEYGGYAVDPSNLRADSVVYSLGVGKDISWDLALIENCGVTIDGFDPTPAVKEWLQRQSVPSRFRFHEFGIADFDGDAAFHIPRRSEFISHSLLADRNYSREVIRAPVMRLRSAMRLLGHDRIDILKMDIEGAEYSVLEDICRERIPVDQLLIEFHHRLSSIGISSTRRALSLLHDVGMKICYVCPRMEVFTFVRVN